jgi:two-component system, NarL family, response regulator NreC
LLAHRVSIDPRRIAKFSGHMKEGVVCPNAQTRRETLADRNLVDRDLAHRDSARHDFAQRDLDGRRIRCILVHDHVLLRQGLRRLLEDEEDIEVVAEAENGSEALLYSVEHRPEVVIADARIFKCGVDRAEQLVLQASPQSKVLFLTHGDEPGGLRDGNNFVEEQTSAEELAEMVRGAYRDGRSAMREMPRRNRGELLSAKAHPQKGDLTAREREVLKLLAEGRTVRSAAGVLGLSVKTVDAHKFNLMRKLGVHNKAELVMWAIQKRVVKLPANW